MTAPQIRTIEILKRLNDTVAPRGAEVGVFSGLMSRELLRSPDLFLFMVDSWKPKDEQPERYKESGDFHSQLSAEQQRRCYWQAMIATEFAENRRSILKMNSIEAAQIIPDGILDFVFLDADHSYDGCREDIEAWRLKVKPGGVLGGHDYRNTEFVQFGVDRAVDEAASRYGWNLDLGKNFTWFARM